MKFNVEEIKKQTTDEYADYCIKTLTEKNSKKEIKNKWMAFRTTEELVSLYKAVGKDGLVLDGKHITLNYNGVSYDYIAFKNKMLLAYPESTIDMALVYDKDRFQFKRDSGHVHYTHELADPFNQTDEKIIGGFCVIKNKRGEFLTTLNQMDFEKHRKVAKQDYIWSGWYPEMCLKTVIKKACKQHFDDLYTNIETIDNENYDVSKPLGISVETKAAIEKLNTVPETQQYYRDNVTQNAGVKEDFIKALSARKEQIVNEAMEAENGNS